MPNSVLRESMFPLAITYQYRIWWRTYTWHVQYVKAAIAEKVIGRVLANLVVAVELDLNYVPTSVWRS